MHRTNFIIVIVALVFFQRGESQTLTAAQVISNPELVHARLRAANPAYRNQAQFEMDSDVGLIGNLGGCNITDLTPLKGIPFAALDLKGLQVSDLSPLKEMPLSVLGLEVTAVTDLKDLSGLRLSKLYLNGTAVSDLKPLSGMPITELMFVETYVKDLTPLRGMPLQQVWLSDTPVEDVSPLAESPVIYLTLDGTNVSDLRPLSKMSTLQRLHIGGTRVSDVTPLKGLHLERLVFTPKSIKTGLEVLRAMKSLAEIGTSLGTSMPPKKFWELYDQGKLK